MYIFLNSISSYLFHKIIDLHDAHMKVSYSTIVLYSRDHKGLGMDMKNITQKPASFFPYDNEAVLVK